MLFAEKTEQQKVIKKAVEQLSDIANRLIEENETLAEKCRHIATETAHRWGIEPPEKESEQDTPSEKEVAEIPDSIIKALYLTALLDLAITGEEKSEGIKEIRELLQFFAEEGICGEDKADTLNELIAVHSKAEIMWI